MTTLYAVGHNMPGYLSEADVWYARTFESAKSMLAEDMNRTADYLSEDANGSEYKNARYLQNLEDSLADLASSTGPEWGDIVDDSPSGTVYWIHAVEMSDAQVAELVALDCVEDN